MFLSIQDQTDKIKSFFDNYWLIIFCFTTVIY